MITFFISLITLLRLIVALFEKGYQIPEWHFDSIRNYHSKANKFPTFQMMFVITACGANSCFYAIQSPMMARFLTENKRYLVTSLLAVFVTVVVVSYLHFSQEGFGVAYHISLLSGIGFTIVPLLWCWMNYVRTDPSSHKAHIDSVGYSIN